VKPVILWWPHLAAELVDIVLREAGGGGVVEHDRLLVPGRVVAYSEEIFFSFRKVVREPAPGN
jgi:hypothetical protein